MGRDPTLGFGGERLSICGRCRFISRQLLDASAGSRRVFRMGAAAAAHFRRSVVSGRLCGVERVGGGSDSRNRSLLDRDSR